MAGTDDLTRPRLLCLHGGGVTAEIFALQLRSFVRPLSSHFRLVFADAPFICAPGPGMIPVFEGMGPYRRWIRWLPDEHPALDDDSVADEIEYALRRAIDDDNARGASGPFVGLVGFSQGAKIAASILYDSELRLRAARHAAQRPLDRGTDAALDLRDMPAGFAGGSWRFAILLAGRAPLVKLGPLSSDSPHMAPAGGISEGGDEFGLERSTARLSLPTVHVHGLLDPGLHLHRRLLKFCCEEGSARLIEWEGDHRVPIKNPEVQIITGAIFDAAVKAGVITRQDADSTT